MMLAAPFSRHIIKSGARYVRNIKPEDELPHTISSINHIFKREIWEKFTEFTFLKF